MNLADGSFTTLATASAFAPAFACCPATANEVMAAPSVPLPTGDGAPLRMKLL